MLKPQPRLTSPLLVRKTLKNNNNYSENLPSTNTISNTYHYNYDSNNKNNNSNNREYYNNNYDINNYNNKPYVTLNGTLNSSKNNHNNNINNNNTNNNSYNNSLLRKTPTPRNYEEFEELLRERREKVYNEHTTTTSKYLPSSSSSPTTTMTATTYKQRPNNDNIITTTLNTTSLSAIPKSEKKYNYDFEFHINLNADNVDDDNDSGLGVGVPPTPPRRAYTLERMQQQQPPSSSSSLYLNNTNNNINSNSVERNYHTISATSTQINRTNKTTTTSPLPYNTTGAYFESERPPLELDVGYKRHFDILQQPQPQQQQHQPKQQQSSMSLLSSTSSSPSSQWPGYNSSKYSIHETTTTYGNRNSAGYIGNHNNNSTNNIELNKRSWQQADILRSDVSPSPIYATSVKHQHQQHPSSNNTMIVDERYDETDGTSFAQYKNSTLKRPETPAFPTTPRTPFSGNDILYQTLGQQQRQNSIRSTRSINGEPQEVAAHLVKFANDSSQYWYKPTLSREEAITLLLNSSPGTFVVRDSTTYKNAYGLVLRVSQPPPGASATGKPDDLVRHFLIEPTTRGVRLKGCANEPVFTSLSALVYEHSINQLALPCLLNIPEHDLMPLRHEPTPAQRQLLTQGAACNVLLLFSCETESLTGEEAIRKAIRQMYGQKSLPTPTEVHFKVSQQGITLTDNTRKIFFRKHYAPDMISYCAIDPDHRLWTMQSTTGDINEAQMKKTIFAFVARRSASSKDNQCHVFCDLAINQPASAIVSFVNKTMPTDTQRNYLL